MIRLLGDCCYATAENTIQLQIQVQLHLFTLRNTSSVLIWCLVNAQKPRGNKKAKVSEAAALLTLQSAVLWCTIYNLIRRERHILAPIWLRREEILPLIKYDNVTSVSLSTRMQIALSVRLQARTETHAHGSVLISESFAAGYMAGSCQTVAWLLKKQRLAEEKETFFNCQ